ncbi:DUF6199 family natural product biosynthesis protein [Paenibacillus senegalensis]|uniref:DUF6199 family natural product biosynthesis protein n=1 Tax=Paenibacillus senegalensis TaxID=1465766 RepID=UPI00030D9E3E|nr:DUF6199 family natural product biosynthesis protein [Paenibacillus senegalensis]
MEPIPLSLRISGKGREQNVFFLFLIVLVAVINIIYPQLGWYMRYGWAVKGDSEPSEAYLVMSRISSVVVLIVLFMALLSGAF